MPMCNAACPFLKLVCPTSLHGGGLAAPASWRLGPEDCVDTFFHASPARAAVQAQEAAEVEAHPTHATHTHAHTNPLYT